MLYFIICYSILYYISYYVISYYIIFQYRGSFFLTLKAATADQHVHKARLFYLARDPLRGKQIQNTSRLCLQSCPSFWRSMQLPGNLRKLAPPGWLFLRCFKRCRQLAQTLLRTSSTALTRQGCVESSSDQLGLRRPFSQGYGHALRSLEAQLPIGRSRAIWRRTGLRPGAIPREMQRDARTKEGPGPGDRA